MDDYELNISVTLIQGCLIVTLPSEMTDDEIKIGTNRIILRVNHPSIVGTLFDLSGVSVLDSYSFTCLENVSKTIRLMGVMVVWIGMKPGIISALLDLDVDVSKIKAALNLEQGLKMIADTIATKSRGAD